MKVVSVATMRALDERTIAAGTPADVLMERAGGGAWREILRFAELCLAPPQRRRLLVVCGKGNNGGDGYVVARHAAAVLPVAVLAVCPPHELHGASRRHADALPADVPVTVGTDLGPDQLAPGTLVVDALLGTGSSGAPRPPYDRLIAQINASRLPVAALDIPSGLDGQTGTVPGAAVQADLTVTMGLPKPGLLTETGLALCGRLRQVDIGMAPEHVAAADGCGEALFAADVAARLDRRPALAHKGTFGTVLVAGGCATYTGAPCLAGAAALRAGAGLVRIAVPASIRPWVRPRLDALITHAVPDAGAGCFGPAASETLRQLAHGSQALVFGPGLGPADSGLAALEAAVATAVPLVLDADGLRQLSRAPALLPRAAGAVVLTPHPGEMRALLAGFDLARYIGQTRTAQAEALAARTGAVVVLKGHGTVLAAADRPTTLNTSGTAGLASAGTGDVLAGLLGGLLAQGAEPWTAAQTAVFVHGLAAELAGGDRALVADDLLNLIGPAWRELTPFA